jgi:hypothetical protein
MSNPITVRLEELRAAYAHLAANPRLHRDDVRSAKDAEHAALFEELQRHRERALSASTPEEKP